MDEETTDLFAELGGIEGLHRESSKGDRRSLVSNSAPSPGPTP